MDQEQLRHLLEQVATGDLAPSQALERLRNLPFENRGLAHVDHHRALRTGFPEVIFGQGKTCEQVLAIAERITAHGAQVLATRVEAATAQALVERFDRAGRSLDAWVYTTEPLACMETSALDGPALALDDEDHLYVVYNLHRPNQKPEAFWAKFAPDGRLLWTRPLAGLFARHIVVDSDAIYIESISQLQLFDQAGEQQVQYAIPALLVASLRLWQGRFAALIEPLALRADDWQSPRLVVYDDPQRAAASRVIGRDPKSHQDRGNGLLLRPTDFAVDEAADRAFVVNAGHSRIEVFQRGHYLTRWGEEGAEDDQFRFTGRIQVVVDMATGEEGEREVVAGGIARDAEGFIYVADTFNDRIQKFQP